MQHPATHRRPTLRPRPHLEDCPTDRIYVVQAPGRPASRRRRRVFDVVARIGTAVTLAAVLVVIASALTTMVATPAPAGVTVTAR